MFLTKCLLCNIIICDENPGENSLDFETEDLPDNIQTMIINNDDKADPFWCCPQCKSDENLIDVTSIEQAFS